MNLQQQNVHRGEQIKSVAVGMRLLECIAMADGPLGITEIARRLESSKAQVYRHIRTFTTLGYVSQDPSTELYAPTMRLFHLGQAIADKVDFISEARRFMVRLRDELGHTVTIGQIEDDGVRIVEILRTRSDIQISTKPGALLGFHATAQGKLALAFGEPEILERVKAGELTRWTEKTNTSVERLEAELGTVRKQGWAVAPEETLIGINALAAPIFDETGAFTGAITIVDSLQFIPPDPSPEQIAAVTRAAAEISGRLGQKTDG